MSVISVCSLCSLLKTIPPFPLQLPFRWWKTVIRSLLNFSFHTGPLIFLHTSNSLILLSSWAFSSDLSLFDLYFSRWEGYQNWAQYASLGLTSAVWSETIISLVMQLLLQLLKLSLLQRHAAKSHSAHCSSAAPNLFYQSCSQPVSPQSVLLTELFHLGCRISHFALFNLM